MRKFITINLQLTKLFFPVMLIAVFSGVALGATFTVTKIADTNNLCDSDCSLREVITVSNATMTDNVIVFDAVVFSTP
jgi:CSLREA domain-containing protein